MTTQQQLIANHIQAQPLLEEWVQLHLDSAYQTPRMAEIEQEFARLGLEPDCIAGTWVLVPCACTFALSTEEALTAITAFSWYASRLFQQEPTDTNIATMRHLENMLARLKRQVKPEMVRG